jgi:hypothetical protein
MCSRVFYRRMTPQEGFLYTCKSTCCEQSGHDSHICRQTLFPPRITLTWTLPEPPACPRRCIPVLVLSDMPPKIKWPQRGDAVDEPEVILYALVALKELYPRKAARKRGHAETVDLEKVTCVTDMFGKQREWWNDIAKALSTHEETKHLEHLHCPGGLMNWFCKKRKAASFDKVTFRDAASNERWKAHLECPQKRARLESHLERAQDNLRAAANERSTPMDTEGETVPDGVGESSNNAVEFTGTLAQEADLLCGAGNGKELFRMLYETEDDNNFWNFNPAAIMGVLQKQCIMLFTMVSILSARPRDVSNVRRNTGWKMLQGTLKLLELMRIRSTHAVPVVALFMAMVFFANFTNRNLIDARAASGASTTVRTLSTFFDARAIRQRSEEVVAERYQMQRFVLAAYDNYVKVSRKIKTQITGRSNQMVEGTMRCAGPMLVPAGLDFKATKSPCSLLSVSMADVLGLVSTVTVLEMAERSQEQTVQLAMAKFAKLANIRGVPFPKRLNPKSVETLKLNTLEFSLENSGTIVGNRNIQERVDTSSICT